MADCNCFLAPLFSRIVFRALTNRVYQVLSNGIGLVYQVLNNTVEYCGKGSHRFFFSTYKTQNQTLFQFHSRVEGTKPLDLKWRRKKTEVSLSLDALQRFHKSLVAWEGGHFIFKCIYSWAWHFKQPLHACGVTKQANFLPDSIGLSLHHVP